MQDSARPVFSVAPDTVPFQPSLPLGVTMPACEVMWKLPSDSAQPVDGTTSMLGSLSAAEASPAIRMEIMRCCSTLPPSCLCHVYVMSVY